MKPKALFIVGLNGSGKSTLRDVMNIPESMVVIDPDKIQREQSLNEISAGRLASKMFSEAIENKADFMMESTLTGKSPLNKIKLAKASGFDVECHYVGLSNVEENIKRVEFRVVNGGHDIPEVTIRRRYDDSFNNLDKLVSVADTLNVYDNTESFNLRAKFLNGHLDYINITDNNLIQGGRMNEFLLNQQKHNTKFDEDHSLNNTDSSDNIHGDEVELKDSTTELRAQQAASQSQTNIDATESYSARPDASKTGAAESETEANGMVMLAQAGA